MTGIRILSYRCHNPIVHSRAFPASSGKQPRMYYAAILFEKRTR